jgi:hypothetical protein
MQVIAQAPAAALVSVNATAAVNAFNVIAGEPGAGTQCNLNLPGSNRLNAQPFVIRAGGIINLAAGTYTATVQPLVFASTTTGFTAAVGNAIAFSTAAVALTFTSTAAVAAPYELELHCIGDTTSGLLQGWSQGQVPTTSTGTAFTLVTASPTILSRILSSVNYATEPPLQFAVGIGLTAGTAAAGSTISLTTFQCEA